MLGRVAAALTRTPVMSTLPTSRAGSSTAANRGVRPAKLQIARGIDATTARVVARFHAVSATVADEMAAALHIRRDRIQVVPRARRRDLLGEPAPGRRSATAPLARPRRRSSPDPRRRPRHPKGLDVLLTAMPVIRAAVPDAVALVAGRRGRMTDELQQAITTGGLQKVVRLLERATTSPTCSSPQISSLCPRGSRGCPVPCWRRWRLGVPLWRPICRRSGRRSTDAPMSWSRSMMPMRSPVLSSAA